MAIPTMRGGMVTHTRNVPYTYKPEAEVTQMSNIGRGLLTLLTSNVLEWKVETGRKDEEGESMVVISCSRDVHEGNPLAGKTSIVLSFWPDVEDGKWVCNQFKYSFNWHDGVIIRDVLLEMLERKQKEDGEKALANIEATIAGWQAYIASKTALEGSGQATT